MEEEVSFLRRAANPGVELIQVSQSPQSCAHLNGAYAFCTLADWQGKFEYRRSALKPSAGDTLLLEPGEFFSLAPSDRRAGSFRVFEVAPTVFEAACKAEGMTGQPHFARFVSRLNPQLEAAFSALQRSFLEDDEPLAHQSALAMLAHAAHATVLEPALRPSVLRDAVGPCARLRERLHDTDGKRINLLDFAREAEVSQFQLLRTFKRRYGATPHAYGLHVRIERARHLLRRGFSVAEAAAATDFTDQSHFTRHFRRVWTVTPGQYARS